MISTNYSNNFFRMFKNVIRRNAVIAAVYQVLSAACIICSLYLSKKYASEIDAVLTTDYIYLYFGGFCIIASFVLAAVLFHDIYSKRATDFLLSIPVKRSIYFNANVIFGVFNIVLSYVISTIILYAVFLYSSKTFDYLYIIKVTSVLLATVIAMFLIFAFCAVVSGKLWHYFLFAFIAIFVISIGAIGAAGYLNTIWGFRINTTDVQYIYPFGIFLKGMIDRDDNLLLRAGISLLYIVAAYVAGLIAFRRRKAEIAENTVSGCFIPAAIIAVSVFSGISFCLSLYELNLYIRITAAVILAFIVTIVLSAAFFRKALAKAAAKGLGASLLISIVFIAVVEFGAPVKYVSYVPQPEEIESAVVYDYHGYGIINLKKIIHSASMFSNPYLFDSEKDAERNKYTYKFTEEVSKEKLFTLHSRLIADKTRKNAHSKENEYNSLKIEYVLKNGKTVTRFYSWSSSDAHEEYAELLRTEEGLKQIDDLNLNKDNLFFAELEFDYPQTFLCNGEEVSEYAALHLEDYSVLLDLIRKDAVNNISTEQFLSRFSSHQFHVSSEKVKAVLTIGLYSFNDYNLSEEQKQMFKNMTPGEILNYNQWCLEESHYQVNLIDTYYFNVTKDNKEILDFIKDYGYSFDEALFDELAASENNDIPETETY